jgi:hypothetical protein
VTYLVLDEISIKGGVMKLGIGIRMSAFAIFVLAVFSMSWLHAQQRPAARVAIDPDDIGGVVTSSKGPEAGVWVIAETTETPTKFARIVVTDDQGRYVLPDLPPATYQVFVRGYGLVDSPRQTAKRGQQLNLTALMAPDAKTAALVYPAAWWLSMMRLPDGAKAQETFQKTAKECYDCHQLGGKATREFQPYVQGATSLEKWDNRTKFGPSGPSMAAFFQRWGADRKAFADWTDAVARG